MANWTHKLDIRDAWLKAENDKDFKSLAKVIVEKLNQINFGPDFNEERDGLVESFEDLILDSSANVNEFGIKITEIILFG